MHFQSNHIFKISTRSYMFRRLRSAIFREPKVILPKLCVCYVVSAEYVKGGSGYRLVWCCQSVGSGYRLVLSVGREWIPSGLVLSDGREWIPSGLVLSVEESSNFRLHCWLQ
jgi:hypothetical protein